ncbi:uncharacterized protein LOC135399233 [Ornithodoros turicata]|uniref:uncharacterized protein LOC135399233 n=1 Tax=Ornithodoros turicata TaxID=34597 RepID=UPI00313A3F98
MQNYNYYPPAYDYVTPNTGYAQQPSQYAMDPSYYAGYGMQGPVREVNAGYPQYQTGPWYNEAPQYTPTYAQQLGPQVAASYPPRVDRRRSSSLRGWQGWHYGPPPGTTAQGPFPQITLEEYRRSMPAYYSPTGQRVAGDPEELGSPGAVPGTPMTLEPGAYKFRFLLWTLTWLT